VGFDGVKRHAAVVSREARSAVPSATKCGAVPDFQPPVDALPQSVLRLQVVLVFALWVRVPSRRFVVVLFLLAQVCDGVLTYAAVQHFGASAEGNPLILTYIGLFGVEPAIVGAKLLASACGIILYCVGTYRVLIALTLLYGAAAIGPWLSILYAL
jgi:hypothetical protein